MESPPTTRRPCFMEGDNGFASLADMEAGFSSPTQTQIQHQNHFISRPLYYTRKTSLRNFSFPLSGSSPRSRRFFDGRFEEHRPHFLDSCFLCKKSLGHNKDIFMYRGDTPFCSEECRQEEIERDEAKEKNRNLSDSRKAFRNQNDQNKTTSQTKKDYAFRTGAVAAA